MREWERLRLAPWRFSSSNNCLGMKRETNRLAARVSMTQLKEIRTKAVSVRLARNSKLAAELSDDEAELAEAAAPISIPS